MLHVHLALFRCEDVIVPLGVGEPLQPVFPGEPVRNALAVLGYASGKVDGAADIERAVSTVGHDVAAFDREAFLGGHLTPVFFGSALHNFG
jgi:hypothetical protein